MVKPGKPENIKSLLPPLKYKGGESEKSLIFKFPLLSKRLLGGVPASCGQAKERGFWGDKAEKGK
jgi:hypothetical protein